VRARGAAAVLAAALAAACGGDPIPGPSKGPVVSADEASVVTGRSFGLTVVRSRPKDAAPEPWSDDVLAPLVVRPVATTVREDGRTVEETRTFRARAFEPGEIRVPAGVAGPGSLLLRVAPSVDPAAPGAMEPPEGPFDPPGRRWLLPAILAAVVAAAALLARGRARPAAAPAAPPPPLGDPAASAAARARARLDALRARGLPEPAAAGPFHEEAAALLRDWLEEGPGVPARTRTSEEIAAIPAAARGAGGGAALVRALRRCDLVKFARHAPPAAESSALLDDAAAALGEGP
jgi:hypothetical protein